MIKNLGLLISQAQQAGYSGTRIWVDMSWTLNPEVDAGQLESWETLLHQVIQHEPVILVCAYNWRLLSERTMKIGQSTHPLSLNEDRIVTNDVSQLSTLFTKHASLLRRLDPPVEVKLSDSDHQSA